MKATILTAVCLVLLSAGFATAQPLPPFQSNYYPLKLGQRWTYRVTDLKTTPVKVDDKIKVEISVEKVEVYTRKNKEGKDESFTGYLLKSTGGQSKLDHVIVLDDGIYRIHTAKVAITPPLQIFKLPLKDGDSWEANSSIGKETIKGTFAAKHDRVNVPAGTYDDAMAIRFRSDPAVGGPFEFTNWYVRDIGMVKQHVKSKDHERLLELQQFTSGK